MFTRKNLRSRARRTRPRATRRYLRRKATRRKYGRNSLPRSVNPAIQMPHMFKLRYHEDITISTNGGGLPSMNWHAFSANGLYDPNISGTGHQPMMFDQLAVFWQRYTVLGAKISLKVVPQPGTTGVIPGAYCGVVLDDNNSLNSANESALIENGKGTFRYINPTYGGSTRSTSLSCRFSAKKFFIKANPSDDDTISAPFTSNPSDQAYFLVWVSCPQTSSVVPFTVSVTIDYIVRCHEPRDIPQS